MSEANLVQRRIVKEKKIFETSLFGKYLVFPVVSIIFFLYLVQWIKVADNKDLVDQVDHYFFTWKNVDLFRVGLLNEHAISTEWLTISNWRRLDVILVGMLYKNQFVGVIKNVTIIPTRPKKKMYSFLFKYLSHKHLFT